MVTWVLLKSEIKTFTPETLRAKILNRLAEPMQFIDNVDSLVVKEQDQAFTLARGWGDEIECLIKNLPQKYIRFMELNKCVNYLLNILDSDTKYYLGMAIDKIEKDKSYLQNLASTILHSKKKHIRVISSDKNKYNIRVEPADYGGYQFVYNENGIDILEIEHIEFDLILAFKYILR